MMKIRNCLLVSISYFSLCSLAQADISAVENEFIFTHTSNTHLASQPQLLSSSNLPQTLSEHRDFSAPISLAVTERIKRRPFASVCFITDVSKCSGNEYGGANTPDGGSSGGIPGSSSGSGGSSGSSGGSSGGGSSSGGESSSGSSGGEGSSSSGGDACAPGDAWCLDNKKRCELEGYTQTSCNSVQNPVNFCPYDNTYFEQCVCKAGLVSCTKPYYGVGESCDGKYASCQLDNPRACKEDGYTQTGSCPSGQTINQKCPYDPAYFDKCVCRSDLISCPSPLQGTGVSCGGKYQSCQCPSNYQSCNCGAAAGASACTWNGVTKYSSCKACCTPKKPASGCQLGTRSCNDGCGGTTTCCIEGTLSKSCSCSLYHFSDRACSTSDCCFENVIETSINQSSDGSTYTSTRTLGGYSQGFWEPCSAGSNIACKYLDIRYSCR